MNILKSMTERLLTIADCVPKTRSIADIGTDHAYIPIYLAQKNVIDYALAMDINEGPLERADKNIKLYMLNGIIKTRLSDGMQKLDDNEVQSVIIAGMGGILINNILENGKNIKGISNYILQPMTAIDETRRYLFENGYNIINERLAKEGDKLYTVIVAKKGTMAVGSEIYLHIGKKLIENKDPLLHELINKKKSEFIKIKSGLIKSKNYELNGKINKLESLISELEKIEAELTL